VSLRVVVPVAIAGAALWVLTAAAASVVLLLLSLVPYPRNAAAGGGLANPGVSAYAPSAEALADIPPSYLALYQSAAARFGLDWTILAGIGKVECDHGRDPDPSCTQEGHLNYAGAGGPAQFLVSTWIRYGITASGSGPPDMWDPADAILSMANYLHAAGAPSDYPRAIYAYNHAWWYVADVLAWARRYRARYGPATGVATADAVARRHRRCPRAPRCKATTVIGPTAVAFHADITSPLRKLRSGQIAAFELHGYPVAYHRPLRVPAHGAPPMRPTTLPRSAAHLAANPCGAARRSSAGPSTHGLRCSLRRGWELRSGLERLEQLLQRRRLLDPA
jgi:hypothetical protein